MRPADRQLQQWRDARTAYRELPDDLRRDHLDQTTGAALPALLDDWPATEGRTPWPVLTTWLAGRAAARGAP
jgi:hypothetical protein